MATKGAAQHSADSHVAASPPSPAPLSLSIARRTQRAALLSIAPGPPTDMTKASHRRDILGMSTYINHAPSPPAALCTSCSLSVQQSVSLSLGTGSSTRKGDRGVEKLGTERSMSSNPVTGKRRQPGMPSSRLAQQRRWVLHSMEKLLMREHGARTGQTHGEKLTDIHSMSNCVSVSCPAATPKAVPESER